jgi:anaerobic magnesium-protoporphyrin IX monomethyl ester cyclase
MRVLCVIPPYVPSYFNAGHHLAVFQVAAHLRRTLGLEVVAVDHAALNAGWTDFARLLGTGFDVVALLNDFDGVDTFPRALRYVRAILPGARTLTFGRLSQQSPEMFERLGVDAVVWSGDPEPGAAGYVRTVAEGTADVPPGVSVRRGSSFVRGAPGELPPPESWTLPDVRDIDYAAYARMYQDDLNKYCGIPDRLELVVPVARGCPVGCAFCDVPWMQGRRERRLSVERVVAYVDEAHALLPFEYVSFYAPTFTLSAEWVRALCARWISAGSPYRWKCTTTLHHLDDALLRTMADAGCVRVSVGVETLEVEAARSLPKAKRSGADLLEVVARACRTAGIELNCFVMLGMPGSTPEGDAATVARIRALAARVRPVLFTAYERLGAEASIEQAGEYNRQIHPDDEAAGHALSSYGLMFGDTGDHATAVQERVPRQSTERP